MTFPSHLSFSVFRRQFTGGAFDAGKLDYDIVRDPAQGLRVPAKGLFIENVGPGTLFYQFSSNYREVSTTIGIDSGKVKSYMLSEIYVAWITLWSDNAATIFTMEATPGVWTDEELVELGLEVM